MAFIPTASLHESYTQYVDDARAAWRALGVELVELEISQLGRAEIATRLAACDVVYVSGGNTFFLLQELQRSGAAALIQSWVQSGKPYVGESAGAAVVAPDVGYMAQLDERAAAPELASTQALGLVHFYPLPHFGNPPFTEAVQAVMHTQQGQLPLQPFSNHQAIEVQGNGTVVSSIPL